MAHVMMCCGSRYDLIMSHILSRYVVQFVINAIYMVSCFDKAQGTTRISYYRATAILYIRPVAR